MSKKSGSDKKILTVIQSMNNERLPSMTKVNNAIPSKTDRKRMGAHYTPPALARLLAEKIIDYIEPSGIDIIRVLDPACGDGNLLHAAMEALRQKGYENCQAFGVESDSQAIDKAKRTLSEYEEGHIELIGGDFLDLATTFQPQQDLWSSFADSNVIPCNFDIVIANPPYVRTQVLGAKRSQMLADRFDLSGRVDLYHAFIQAMIFALREGGVLGIITSNRFMSTLAGKSVRAFLTNKLEILEIIDLGDTKLFEAAVLPSLLFGRRHDQGRLYNRYSIPFTKIYSQLPSTPESNNFISVRDTIVEAVAAGDEGIVKVFGGTFNITRGRFPVTPGSSEVWALLTSQQKELLTRLIEKSERRIEEVACVKVGVKTTADDVFIRNDWASLPFDKRPEEELLKPVLSHEDTYRWAMPRQHTPDARILYPHFYEGGSRRIIALEQYPRSHSYLEDYRARLEGRRYLVDAGRRWYEVWVPQDPNSWGAPKIVFPDISPEPRFCFVEEEYIVNGDCYWMTLRQGVKEEILFLILGIANSSLMTRFHDASFSNKLYSGRRRYITQYVSKYPLPNAHTEIARSIISLTRELVNVAKSANADEVKRLEIIIDTLVYKAFGLNPDGEPL
ncbi:N-6 DNA methylase [Candidatus Sumerlaeota bacterium]|nr:N-6 DNA methylase [Candidatus Sumerlaeota bacterium]